MIDIDNLICHYCDKTFKTKATLKPIVHGIFI